MRVRPRVRDPRRRIRDPRDGFELRAPAAALDIQHADAWSAPGGDVGIGGEWNGTSQRHEHVSAVGRDREQVGRRIGGELVDELNAVDDLIDARVDHP